MYNFLSFRVLKRQSCAWTMSHRCCQSRHKQTWESAREEKMKKKNLSEAAISFYLCYSVSDCTSSMWLNRCYSHHICESFCFCHSVCQKKTQNSTITMLSSWCMFSFLRSVTTECRVSAEAHYSPLKQKKNWARSLKFKWDCLINTAFMNMVCVMLCVYCHIKYIRSTCMNKENLLYSRS